MQESLSDPKWFKMQKLLVQTFCTHTAYRFCEICFFSSFFLLPYMFCICSMPILSYLLHIHSYLQVTQISYDILYLFLYIFLSELQEELFTLWCAITANIQMMHIKFPLQMYQAVMFSLNIRFLTSHSATTSLGRAKSKRNFSEHELSLTYTNT